MRNKKIKDLAREVVYKKIAPHVSVIAVKNKKIILKISVGKKQNIFDVASVTKIIFTTPIIIKLVSEKKLNLNQTVERYLNIFKKHKIGKIKIKSLLNQTSGLVWWRPFFKRLNKYPLKERKFILVKEFFKENTLKTLKPVYSDLNFILLGWVIESIYNDNLENIFKKHIAESLKLRNTKFKVKNVNDQNCQSMGGVSSHAGLFSSQNDMVKIGNEYLSALKGKSKLKMKKQILLKFIKKSKPGWGLGVMKPSRPISTGGTKISLNSFGFPGFTGPSLWIDVKREAFVVIMAERNKPSHKNKRFAPYRVRLHDLAWELVDEKK
ncbi:MAG: serine hydrolase [Oligoflexia bacterium]|nr:serine hydrolase [Oligoflexia bacterium]